MGCATLVEAHHGAGIGIRSKGPYSSAPATTVALGFSGYMYPTGFPDRFPVRPAFPTADYNTGTFAALAAMFALYQRDLQGGEGQLIDLALYEKTFRITGDMVDFLRSGKVRERIGRNPTFAPAVHSDLDGRYVQIAAGGGKVFQRFTQAMGMLSWQKIADTASAANAWTGQALCRWIAAANSPRSKRSW